MKLSPRPRPITDSAKQSASTFNATRAGFSRLSVCSGGDLDRLPNALGRDQQNRNPVLLIAAPKERVSVAHEQGS